MSDIRITNVIARAVLAPFTITPKSASGSLDHAAMVLIDIETSEGIVGHSYLFAFGKNMLKPLVESINALSPVVIGDVLAPLSLEAKLRGGLRLMDTPGLIGLALSGVDMAFWDAHCKKLGQPLNRVLGAARDSVPAYNSCGLWIQDVDSLADEAEQLLAANDFNAVKLRLGRAVAKDDLQAVKHVRKRIGDNAHLMVDFNQSQSVRTAIDRSQMLDDEGLYWIEEPVRHADYKGTAAIRQAVRTPIQTGENLNSSFELKLALDEGAADYYMPDVQRIGGVSGWLRAAALCHAAEVEMSSHLFPEFSVHLLAASPTCHWLEYVDWAKPLLQEPLEIINGQAQVPDRPGAGISWNEDYIKRYLV